MQKKMEPVTVRTTDDAIIIEQESGAEEASGIVLARDQIPLLVQWLEEARKTFTPS